MLLTVVYIFFCSVYLFLFASTVLRTIRYEKKIETEGIEQKKIIIPNVLSKLLHYNETEIPVSLLVYKIFIRLFYITLPADYIALLIVMNIQIAPARLFFYLSYVNILFGLTAIIGHYTILEINMWKNKDAKVYFFFDTCKLYWIINGIIIVTLPIILIIFKTEVFNILFTFVFYLCVSFVIPYSLDRIVLFSDRFKTYYITLYYNDVARIELKAQKVIIGHKKELELTLKDDTHIYIKTKKMKRAYGLICERCTEAVCVNSLKME